MTNIFTSGLRARRQRDQAKLARENATSPAALVAAALNNEFFPAFSVLPAPCPVPRVQILREGYTADILEAKDLRDLYRGARSAIRTIFWNQHRRAA